MKIGRLSWSSVAGSVLVMVCLVMHLAGCAAENTSPLPTEQIGATTAPAESMAIDIDARGYLNGLLFPDQTPKDGFADYPVSYVGSWTIAASGGRKNWYMAVGSVKESHVDIVGTMTRVVFDFWDYHHYQDPGVVSFWLDGVAVGSFNLARSAPSGQSIMDYMVYTGKTTMATVTMKIESGRAVIAGYRFFFPPIPTAK